MTKSEKLLEAIGGIRPEIVEDALAYRPPKEKKKRKPLTAEQTMGLIAAVLVLVVAVVPLITFASIWSSWGMGSSGGDIAGGNPGAGGNVYDSYAGPVFPLLSREDAAGVTAERNVDFDFSDYDTGYGTFARVEDSYVLTNSGETEQTLELLYPALYSMAEGTGPIITVDGKTVEATAWPGTDALVGGCDIESWEGYQTLLEDGTYLQNALSTDAAILDQTVTVYEITDLVCPEKPEGVENWYPGLNFRVTLSGTDTGILTYGFAGMTRVDEQTRIYSADLSWSAGDNPCLITLGGNLSGYSIEGYSGYGTSEGAALVNLTGDVQTYETTLKEILSKWMLDYLRRQNDNIGEQYTADGDFIDRCMVQMARDGLEEFALYDTGALEDRFSATLARDRVAYWSFEVTIPAGGRVSVSAWQTKSGSCNYYADVPDDPDDTKGYDMVTTLGSNLTFTAQTASLTGAERIEIVEQNFGFDVKNGVTKVALDLKEPEYYLNVKPKEEQ